MAARAWKFFTVICLISVYSLTFVGLHYRFVYSFFLLSALLHVCGCILFELGMMKVVIPYDHGHKEVYNAFIMRTETELKTAVFLAKPTETDRRQNVWNRNNTTNFNLFCYEYGLIYSTMYSSYCWHFTDWWNSRSVALSLHCMAGLPSSRVANCFSRLPVCNSTGEGFEWSWSTTSDSLQCWHRPLWHNLPCWHLSRVGLLHMFILYTVFQKKNIHSFYWL